MTNFCGSFLDVILVVSAGTLIVSLLIGAGAAAAALIQTIRAQKGGQLKQSVDSAPAVSTLVDALKGIIEALANAPAWFAVFLAGVLLFWLAAGSATEGCKPRPTMTRPEATTTMRADTTTRTAPAGLEVVIRVSPTAAVTPPRPAVNQ